MEPHSLVRGTGEGGWVGMGLACGLQDQRLMARPPARAGGRSGLLTGGESGKPNGYFLPSPKGDPPTSPARPAGGRAVTSVPTRGPQARYPVRDTASPHTTPPEKGVPGGEPPPPGVLSPISSQEMGPRLGKPSSLPFQRRKETLHPHPGRLPPNPLPNQKHRRAPQAPAVFFSARRKRPPQSPISRSRFTISTALRAQS